MDPLTVVGIVSNIIQLADFCMRVTDRAVEFSGRVAELPGSFSDLRVVLAVVRLNLRRLSRRLQESNPDQETLETLKDLVTIIEREVEFVREKLGRLPAPGASWAQVTVRAIASVFSEGKVKKSTDSILQNVELLSQTVTASLPTADEIAKAVNEKSTTAGIDRKLSLILDKMKSQAITRANTNATAFTNRSQENRISTNHGIKVKGHTQINNTYITLQIPYEDFGAQLDSNGGRLMVPGSAKDLAFLPLKQAISNPNLYEANHGRRKTEPTVVVAAPAFDMPAPLDLSFKGLNLHSLTESAESLSRPKALRTQTTQTVPLPSSRIEMVDENDDPSAIESATVVGSGASAHGKAHFDDPLSPSDMLLSPQTLRHHRTTSAPPRPTVPVEQLHQTVFELPTEFPPLAPASTIETLSEVGTASDIWSETMVAPNVNDAMSTVTTSTTVSEDTESINLVNAYIRSGAHAVTKNPSEAKRAYMSALNTGKQLVTFSPAFSVRKYRALTLAAVGLSLCTQDRDRYLQKARGYNAQAMTAAVAARDVSVELRVMLDEADLQMKEARMQEKGGQDATMKQFTAFGAYQDIASRLTQKAMENARQAGRGRGEVGTTLALLNVADCNTHGQALLGCGKAATLLSRHPGGIASFRTSSGAAILSPRAYYEQALAACRAGAEAGFRQQQREKDWNNNVATPGSFALEDLAMLKDTEELIQKLLNPPMSAQDRGPGQPNHQQQGHQPNRQQSQSRTHDQQTAPPHQHDPQQHQYQHQRSRSQQHHPQQQHQQQQYQHQYQHQQQSHQQYQYQYQHQNGRTPSQQPRQPTGSGGLMAMLSGRR